VPPGFNQTRLALASGHGDFLEPLLVNESLSATAASDINRDDYTDLFLHSPYDSVYGGATILALARGDGKLTESKQIDSGELPIESGASLGLSVDDHRRNTQRVAVRSSSSVLRGGRPPRVERRSLRACPTTSSARPARLRDSHRHSHYQRGGPFHSAPAIAVRHRAVEVDGISVRQFVSLFSDLQFQPPR
jgi:hypothetical protein